jgi:hypothetical protein
MSIFFRSCVIYSFVVDVSRYRGSTELEEHIAVNLIFYG